MIGGWKRNESSLKFHSNCSAQFWKMLKADEIFSQPSLVAIQQKTQINTNELSSRHRNRSGWGRTCSKWLMKILCSLTAQSQIGEFIMKGAWILFSPELLHRNVLIIIIISFLAPHRELIYDCSKRANRAGNCGINNDFDNFHKRGNT